ncbi:MAG: D-glycero-beta-D-manno-heptose-7-phosphate kinase, partial [Proteobacteria bacterium]|nr:D-glycero-beta-D-manno-heptose-7-phosphate kinase [Pseudomonadota bacterium]
MMDQFIWGRVGRISPEAPVPVVDVDREEFLLGGAANVVRNIASLGGGCDLVGVVGDDQMGRRVIRDVAELGGDAAGL